MQGRHIPAAVLNSIVVNGFKQRLLTPERLASLLQMLTDRQTAKTEAVDRQLAALQRKVAECEDRLWRLYR